MKKVLREMQTLHAGCSKEESKEHFFVRPQTLPGGAGWPKFNQLQKHTNKQTHRQDRLQYTALRAV